MATRSNIVRRVTKRHPSLREEDLVLIVHMFFSLITDYLRNNCRVEIRGFGSFSIRNYSLKSQNTRLRKDKYLKVYFRSGASLIDALNKES